MLVDFAVEFSVLIVNDDSTLRVEVSPEKSESMPRLSHRCDQYITDRGRHAVIQWTSIVVSSRLIDHFGTCWLLRLFEHRTLSIIHVFCLSVYLGYSFETSFHLRFDCEFYFNEWKSLWFCLKVANSRSGFTQFIPCNESLLAIK